MNNPMDITPKEQDPFTKAYFDALQKNLPQAYPMTEIDDKQSATRIIRAGMYFFSNFAVAKEFLVRASEEEIDRVAAYEGAKMAVDLVEHMRRIVETYDLTHSGPSTKGSR